jgi:predicted DNA-binding transcriptional regulator AlpA
MEIPMSKGSRHLRYREAMDMTGVKKTVFFDRIKQGLLPKPIDGVAGKRLIESEVMEVMRAREAGWSDDRIKALVSGLAAERAQPSWSEREERVPREPDPQTEHPKRRMIPIIQLAGDMTLSLLAMKPPRPPMSLEEEVDELDRPSENQSKKLFEKLWSSMPAEQHRIKAWEKTTAMVAEAASKWKLSLV